MIATQNFKGRINYQIIKSLQFLSLPTDFKYSRISASLRIELCFVSYLNYIRIKRISFLVDLCKDVVYGFFRVFAVVFYEVLLYHVGRKLPFHALVGRTICHR